MVDLAHEALCTRLRMRRDILTPNRMSASASSKVTKNPTGPGVTISGSSASSKPQCIQIKTRISYQNTGLHPVRAKLNIRSLMRDVYLLGK
ncbi:hypothetical protein TW697 [Tropheryma whipplei TW08/27]|nr:hypothetical protein TW697 [Tropheryma whipplei TW08/27]